MATFGINIRSALQGAWREEVDDRRREGSWDILDHPDSITGYPDDPDELEDDLKYDLEDDLEDDLENDIEDNLDDDLEDDLEDVIKDELEGPAEKIGVSAAVTQLDDTLSSLNIQRSDPSTN